MLEDKILEKIEEKKIKPKSRFSFLIKEYAIWSVFALAIIVGSVAVSVCIFAIKNNDWDIYKYANDNLLAFILSTMPYFWIVLLLIFVFFGYINFKHTKRGYRYKFNLIILSSILISILFGFVLYKFGFGEIIDKTFSKNVPVYKNLFCENLRVWHNPENGILVAEITGISSKNITVKDINNISWTVNYNTSLIGKELLVVGNKVKILGEIRENNIFFANEIRESRCGCDHKNCNCASERNNPTMRNTSCMAN